MFVGIETKRSYNSFMNSETDSKLRSVLKNLGIRPSEFARMMDVNTQTVTNWFTRGVPHAKALKVARVLGVPVESVSQWSDTDSPKPREVTSAKDFMRQHASELDQLDENDLLKLAGMIEQFVDNRKK